VASEIKNDSRKKSGAGAVKNQPMHFLSDDHKKQYITRLYDGYPKDHPERIKIKEQYRKEYGESWLE